MDDVIRIVVPGKPKGAQRANAAPLMNRKTGKPILNQKTGRPVITVYTPTEMRNEMAVIRYTAINVMGGRSPLEGPIELKIMAWLPVPKSFSNKKRADALAGLIIPTVKPDFDNIAKYVDALKHVVWRDDSQVSSHGVWKRYSEHPRVIIEVRRDTRIIVDIAREREAAAS